MRPNLLSDYLSEIDAAFQALKACHFEKYEEELLGSERANLRVRARFAAGHLLEVNEAITIVSGGIAHLSYRYHFQDKTTPSFFDTTTRLISPSLKHFQTTSTCQQVWLLR